MAISRDTAGFIGGSSAELERHYRRVLDRILAEMALGVSRPGAARAQALIREINRFVDQLHPRKQSFVRDWIKREGQKAFVLGDRQATRELRKSLASAPDPSAREVEINRAWTAVNQTGLRAVSAAMETHLTKAAEDLRAGLGLVIRRTQQRLVSDQSIRDATVEGIIRGSTARKVADDIAAAMLRRKVSPEVKARLRASGFDASMFRDFAAVARGTFVQAGARRMSIASYADLVARTQLREAHRVATVVRLQQNAVDHVQISRHVQAKADECTPYAGRVFYIGALPRDPLGFPNLKSLPNTGVPFHPNCKHVLMPFVTQFQTKNAIEKAQRSAEALPKRFLGKTSGEVRDLVSELSDKELQAIAPEGFEDIAEEAA